MIMKLNAIQNTIEIYPCTQCSQTFPLGIGSSGVRQRIDMGSRTEKQMAMVLKIDETRMQKKTMRCERDWGEPDAGCR